MRNISKISTFTISLLFSSIALAQEEPIYECTPEETAMYIEGATFGLSTASNTPTAEQAQQAYLDEKQKEGDDDCFALFSGEFNLDEEWNSLVKEFNRIPGNLVSINGAIIEALQKAFDQIRDQIMEELNKGICERIDAEAISSIAEEIANRKLEEMTGIDFSDFKESLRNLTEDELYDMFGPESEYIFNPERYEDDQKEEVKNKLRVISRDFWDDI